jgi:hypothetical protein
VTEIDDLLAPRKTRRPCKVGRALDAAPDDVRARFEAAIADERVSGNKIVLALAKAEIVDVSPTSFREHRRGDCGCDA